jgi:hypothetical protein
VHTNLDFYAFIKFLLVLSEENTMCYMLIMDDIRESKLLDLKGEERAG